MSHLGGLALDFTPLEFIVFPSMLVLLMPAVAVLVAWTVHSGHRSPVSPKRQRLRTYRELSPTEFAVAAHRDPATVLIAAVIDLVQSGKAVVAIFAPLALSRGPVPITDPFTPVRVRSSPNLLWRVLARS